MQERTQKDLDIVRQSSLKAAVELITAFPDKIEAKGRDGIISTTTKVADQLVSWILNPVPVPEEQPTDAGHDSMAVTQLKNHIHRMQDAIGEQRTDFSKNFPLTGQVWRQVDIVGLHKQLAEAQQEELPEPDEPVDWGQRVRNEIHKLQRKLEIPLTDWTVPGPQGEWDGESETLLLEQLREQVKKSSSSRGNGNSELKMSPRQYRYILDLHRRVGIEPDKPKLKQMTPVEASALIDELSEEANTRTSSNGGNGSAGGMSPKQKNYLSGLIQRTGSPWPENFDDMTRSEASGLIEKLRTRAGNNGGSRGRASR